MSLFDPAASEPAALEQNGPMPERASEGGSCWPQLPVLFLPVRLETRFMDAANGPELWVRIYPDQIAVDTHEPELTDAEIKLGQTYWDVVWRTGKGHPEEEKIPWRALATALGPQRAAWVALALTPTNLDQRPADPTAAGQNPNPAPVYPANIPTRPRSWTRASLAQGLPDYWTVVTYVNGVETHRVTSAAVRSPLAVGMKPNPDLPRIPPRCRSMMACAGWLTSTRRWRPAWPCVSPSPRWSASEASTGSSPAESGRLK